MIKQRFTTTFVKILGFSLELQMPKSMCFLLFLWLYLWFFGISFGEISKIF